MKLKRMNKLYKLLDRGVLYEEFEELLGERRIIMIYRRPFDIRCFRSIASHLNRKWNG